MLIFPLALRGGGVISQMQAGDLYGYMQWKAPVRLATTAAGTLASDFEDGDTLDGLTLVTGDRILIKNQADFKENGIYVVAASGPPARAEDADTGAKLYGAAVHVLQGVANPDTFWSQAGSEPTIGTSSIFFNKFGGANTGYTNQSNTWLFAQIINTLYIADTVNHKLRVKPNEALTADRTLNLITGDADRTLTFTANATIGGTHSGTSSGTNTGDQTIPTNTYGQSVLASNFNLTAADDVYQATGLSVSLPAAGTYLITGSIVGAVGTTVGGGYIVGKLRNTTDSADVTSSEVFVVYGPAKIVSAALVAIVTVAAAKTIELYVMRNAEGGTWSFSDIRASAVGRTKLSYVKIA